jgi:hypothetical protein
LYKHLLARSPGRVLNLRLKLLLSCNILVCSGGIAQKTCEEEEQLTSSNLPITMDSFDGYWMSEAPSMWIHRLDLCFQEEWNYQSDSEKVSRCKFYLKGYALEWYEKLDTQSLSWNNFRHKFCQKFFRESPMYFAQRLFEYRHYPNNCFDYFYTMVRYIWESSQIPFNFPDFYFHIVSRCSEPELKKYLEQFNPSCQEELDEIYVAYADKMERYHVVKCNSNSDNVNRPHSISFGAHKPLEKDQALKSTATSQTQTITKKISRKSANVDQKSSKLKFASKGIDKIKLTDREKIIRSFHERDHSASVSSLAKQISRFYFWPKLYRSIKRCLRRLKCTPVDCVVEDTSDDQRNHNEDVVFLERGRMVQRSPVMINTIE